LIPARDSPNCASPLARESIPDQISCLEIGTPWHFAAAAHSWATMKGHNNKETRP